MRIDSKTPEDASDLLLKLARNYKGVFVGEHHDEYGFVAANLLVQNLTKLKEQGTTTIYIEYNPEKAKAAQGGLECRKEWMGPSEFPDNTKYNSMQFVIDNALAAGLRVIGHDSLTGTSYQWDKIDKEPKLMPQLVNGPQALSKRDHFSAKLIHHTDDGGRYIVYGGWGHSGNEANRVEKGGLSERLGIPSIDVKKPKVFFDEETPATLAKAAALTKKAEQAGAATPVFILPGGTGSTWKVTTVGKTFEDPRGSIPIHTEAGKARLEAAAAEARASGACTYTGNRDGSDYLDRSEIPLLFPKGAGAETRKR